MAENISHWNHLIEGLQSSALDFYTALFCLDFMGELGHRFNRPEAEPVDRAYVERLQGLLDRYLA